LLWRNRHIVITIFSLYKNLNYQQWRAERDASRTPQPQTVQLLVKLYKKRSMGMLISPGQPIDTSLPYQKGILSR